jgi:hypothetical protein
MLLDGYSNIEPGHLNPQFAFLPDKYLLYLRKELPSLIWHSAENDAMLLARRDVTLIL